MADIEREIMSNIKADAHTKLADAYDQLIAKCFEKYGIELDIKSREAMKKWSERIKVEILGDNTLPTTIHVWRLDGIELFKLYQHNVLIEKDPTHFVFEARHVVEFSWQPCRYIDLKLQHNGTWKDGAWYEWKDTNGNIETARMKLDAYDHFFPDTKVIKEEDVVAYRPTLFGLGGKYER